MSTRPALNPLVQLLHNTSPSLSLSRRDCCSHRRAAAGSDARPSCTPHSHSLSVPVSLLLILPSISPSAHQSLRFGPHMLAVVGLSQPVAKLSCACCPDFL
jgi:hypothetical protein